MKVWMGFIIVAPIFAFVLQACGPKAKTQDDCGFVQNVYGERISWQDRLPILLYVHQSVPSEFYSALESSMASWEAAAGKPMFRIVGYGVYGANEPTQDGINMIYFLNTWEAKKSSEQGRTSVYWVGDEIREADIRINAKDFTFYQTNSAAKFGQVNIESLLIHELGHVLGLKHNDTISNSVMGTYLMSEQQRTNLTGIDRSNLICEYQ
jgi:hypothetical protein